MDNLSNLKEEFSSIRNSADPLSVRGLLSSAVRRLPKAGEFLDMFVEGFELLNKIPDPHERRVALLDFVKEIPPVEPFLGFYVRAMDAAVTAADELEEIHQRITELLRIANELPKTKDFQELRVRAWRLVLSLPDKPHFRKVPAEVIAKDLPKSSDLAFYKGYTLLGIAKQAPKDGVFLDVYKEAIQLALDAVEALDEPYYKKYALLYIANELPKTDEVFPLYKKTIEKAFSAIVEIKDPFAKEYGLIEILQMVPKTAEFIPLLQNILEQSIAFFTVKKWMEDLDVLDVVDYILSAEDLGIKESKKKRFSREKYAGIVSRELEKFGMQMNDTRLIETLRPYTHVWVRPKNLREAVKKVVDNLESLKSRFHGKEVERPVFIGEFHPFDARHFIHKKDARKNDCIAIDLGATNTVVVRKKADSEPVFLSLPGSRRLESLEFIPTILSSSTNAIGADVVDENPVVDIKQTLLEGQPRGKENMEKFFKTLYQNIKKQTVNTGFLSLMAKNPSEFFYITVPVGYQDYKNSMKEIVEKTARGIKAEFIEEPLAACIGYQVAEARDKTVMVIDFGGCTLNTMVLRININEVHIVAKPERAQILGGRDIDLWVAGELAKKIGLSAEEPPYSLISAAEEIKIGLSKNREAGFEWEGRQVCTVSREDFEETLERHEFYRFIDRAISGVLKKAEKVGVRKELIEAVLITGGSSQIPSFKDKVGHIFPELRKRNLIYDHSPLSAVSIGAVLYGTRDVTDRHLGIAYAIRFTTKDKENPFSLTIVLEKGELLPIEKTFRFTPAKKLCVQEEIYLELFEVPERLIARRWVMESGIEFLKQELTRTSGVSLNALPAITLDFKEPMSNGVDVTFCVSESGELSLKYGQDNKVIETGIRLQ